MSTETPARWQHRWDRLDPLIRADGGVLDELTAGERLTVDHHDAAKALCLRVAPPAVPNVQWSCERCGSVFATFRPDPKRDPYLWDWRLDPTAKDGNCRHRRIVRHPEGTVDCNDQCGGRFADHGVWFPSLDISTRIGLL